MSYRSKTLIAMAIAVGVAVVPLTNITSASAADALPQTVQDALTSALMDEYHAEAFYDAVLHRFGQVRPFANIIRAEQNHASAIITLMNVYGMAIPDNTLLGSAQVAAAVPATLGAACSVGVQAEIDNAALYNGRLLPAVSGYADITFALKNLRDTSQNMHLPAFQRCATSRPPRKRRSGPRPIRLSPASSSPTKVPAIAWSGQQCGRAPSKSHLFPTC